MKFFLVFTFLILSINTRFIFSKETECTKDEFDCGDGNCHFTSYLCDGNTECANGFDEQNCFNHTCQRGFEKCDNGWQCVFFFYICDGTAHCKDNSDEIGCGECTVDQFSGREQCMDKSGCVGTLAFCNGGNNCNDGLDEAMCPDKNDGISNKCKTSEAAGIKIKTKPIQNNCSFGVNGRFCNETCWGCVAPFCTRKDFVINKEYFIINGNNQTLTRDFQCVPKSVDHLEMYNVSVNVSNVFETVGHQLFYLVLSNFTNHQQTRNSLSTLKDSLQFLFIHYTSQLDIPDLSRFLNLILLDLRYNEITNIKNTMLDGTRRLLRLTLSHNKISNIEENSFLSQTGLKELMLSFNEIKTLENFSYGLTDLIVLDLSYNCIETLTQGMFRDLYNLEKLFLLGNPLSPSLNFELKGISIFNRAEDQRFKIYTPFVTQDGDVLLDINCTNFKLIGKCDPFLKSATRRYNELVFTDEIDDCNTTSINCPDNSTCLDLIGEAICLENAQCNCNTSGFIKNQLSCIKRLESSTNELEESTCFNNCRCKGKDGFICHKQVLGLFDVSVESLCVPSTAKKLILDNVLLVNANKTLSELLSRFVKLTAINFKNFKMPVNELMSISKSLVEDVTALEMHNVGLLEFPKEFINLFPNLKNLTVCGNEFSLLPNHSFEFNPNLREVTLSDNLIKEIDIDALLQTRLNYINISGNQVETYKENILANQSSLQYVYGDHFKICCLAYLVSNNISDCQPTDAVSSCSRLIDNTGLRVLIWIQAFLAGLGNALTLGKRYLDYRRANVAVHDKVAKTNTFMVGVLAVADLMMAIYLFIIGSQDVIFAGEYYKHAQAWEHSYTCKAAGVLSLFSSQASVFTLTLITVSRLLSVVFPFCYRTTNTSIFQFTTFLIWSIALVLAVVPLMGFPATENYFAASGVCLPSWYTSTDVEGWEYTMFLTLLNLLSFVAIFLSYGVLVRKVYVNERKTHNSKKSRNSTLGIRVMLIVATDFLCWFPICIAALVSIGIGGFTTQVFNSIYPITAILLLPINSALNPIIYTLLPCVSIQKIRHGLLKRKKQLTSLSFISSSSGKTNKAKDQTVSMPCTVSASVYSSQHNHAYEDDENSKDSKN